MSEAPPAAREASPTPRETPSTPREAPPTLREASWRSPEVVGELVLLGVMAALSAVYLFQVVALPVGRDCVEGNGAPLEPVSCFLFSGAPGIADQLGVHDLRLPGRWLPLIAIVIGAPFWVIRLVTTLRRRKDLRAGMIMDLGFRLGEDPEAERRRAFLYFGTLVLFVLLVWLIGFHAGMPLWVGGYLALWTRMRRWQALLIAGAFEAFIIGVLDMTLDIFWFEPLVFRWIGVEYPVNDWFTRVF